VIIDSRELRSQLPLAFFDAGFRVQIANIKSADYVIDNILGAERKAIETSDLLQSLEHGRLYKQLLLLKRTYSLPILLLECADNYCLPVVHEIYDSLSKFSYHAKLSVLAIKFPSIPFVWSASPRASVELLSDIANSSTESIELLSGFSSEDTALQVLEKLPGITPDNIDNVLNSVQSLRELFNMSLETLICILGSKQDAIVFRNFLDTDILL